MDCLCPTIRLTIEEEDVVALDVTDDDCSLEMEISDGGGGGEHYEKKELFAVPADFKQVFIPEIGSLYEKVTVAPIPENYGKITYDGAVLTVS